MEGAPTQPNWRVAAASAPGTSHQQSGLPCQDAYAFAELPTGELVIAVADGAGTARHAATGSAVAVQQAQHFLTQFLDEWEPNSATGWQALLQATFAEARRALIDQAQQQGEPLRDFAATLLVAVLSDAWSVAGLVGDCAVVYRGADEQLVLPCRPQKGEYANTTNFLTSVDALTQLDIQIFPQPMRGVAAFSDGLAELALNTRTYAPHPRFFAPLFAFAASQPPGSTADEQLAAFLASERINARTSDDKTLVLAWRE